MNHTNNDNTPDAPGNDELLELIAADALGALSTGERTHLRKLEDDANPELQQWINDARDRIAAQMQADLPKVEPDASLRYRVLAYLSHCVEHDFDRSTNGMDNSSALPFATPQNWFMRLVGSQVSSVWRVAALVAITATVGLSWSLVATLNVMAEWKTQQRYADTAETIQDLGGKSTFEFIASPDAQHFAFVPVKEESEARAAIAFFPNTNEGLLMVKNLPEEEKMYELHVSAQGIEDSIVISLTSKGTVVGIDFDIPVGIPNPMDAHWYVSNAPLHANDPVEVVLEYVPG